MQKKKDFSFQPWRWPWYWLKMFDSFAEQIGLVVVGSHGNDLRRETK